MPRKPKTPCIYPGCPLLVDGGRYCNEHAKERIRQYNKYGRAPEINKRYDGRWQKIRRTYVAKHPLCEICLEKGVAKVVQEVHHLTPLADGGTHEEENLIALCHACHAAIHTRRGDYLGARAFSTNSL